MEELVSIVIPVHNAEKYLEQTVESVLAQSYKDYELILVDDASSDGSAALMKELAAKDKRIRLLSNEGPHGAAHARNCGIDAAKGRYLAFLDADDLWLPEKLKRTLRFLKKQDASFVFTGYEFGDENAQGTGKVVHVPSSLDYEHALSRTVIFTSTVLLDMKRLGKKIVHMPDVESEDTACWWQILKSGVSARGLDARLVIYRRPAASLSSNKMVAVKRIWKLYRQQEKLGLIKSVGCLLGWAWRATARRL
ncbi:MAG: glycosyltransferase family 2 protein [Lachnospiraceae bacterium]|nr:glycosyltransferase family 2 protein [Lachnospiraceae bacterium]